MRFIVALLVLATACGPKAPRQPTFPDAPMQLRDDSDRDQAIDQLWVMPLGPQRDGIRLKIARAVVARIGDALAEDKPFVAEMLLFQLASLWQLDPQAIAQGVTEHVDVVRQLRATFAKSGAIEPTIATLVMLSEIEPSKRTEHLNELDEVLHFADELEAAENGPEAQRAQPIKLLQPTVLALPLRWLVDRYVALLVERQRVITTLINQQGASIQLVRAHHDILATSQRIAIALARAGRPHEIYRQLADMKGLGHNRELTIRAEVLAEHPTAVAYADLAEAIRSDKDNPDPGASLMVCLVGLQRFPTDAGLLAAAAGDAADLGRVDQPIELYEAAIAASGGSVESALALRLGKLYAERIARLAFGGRPGAAQKKWRELDRYARNASGGKASRHVWSMVAAGAETALGKGLLSQGRLRDAERALVASIDRAPSFDAYETLATIHYKTDRFASASRYAHAGIALLGESRPDLVRRAKLARIAADVARTAGKSREAANLYVEAMRSWAELGSDDGLEPDTRAERKLEAGHILWFLGESAKAVNLVFDAIDANPSSASNYAEAVAFLMSVGSFADAIDIVHRSLSQSEVGDFYKVYMCLWIAAEAHRRGEPRDRQVNEFLASRQGDLWYELLAQAATKRIDLAALRAAATTAPRQAELLFYSVALGLDPEATSPAAIRKTLQQVVDAHLVMDAEYDLARQYLARP
jgi:tetratricopeptide (TPR) repeat protein